MTEDTIIQLDNAAGDVAALFDQAAERARAQAAFDEDPAATGGVPPLGVQTMADAASRGFDRYVALQTQLDALPLLPASPAPAANEPEGLTGDHLLKFRQLHAIRPVLP